ncbi:hypothetical protein [Haloarcula halophila]|nr:hypothetical protein [Halomicroarcula sp. DFY41]
MSIIHRITNTVRSKSRTHVCRFCRLSFEKQRTNCPACGCNTIEPDR